MALGSNFVAISYLFAFLHTIIPTIAVSLDYCSSFLVFFNPPEPAALLVPINMQLRFYKANHAGVPTTCRVALTPKVRAANPVLGTRQRCPSPFSATLAYNFLASSITFSNSTWNYERMAPKTFDEAATSQAAITVTVTSSQSGKMVTTSSSTSTSTATATSGVSTSSGAIITQTLPPGAGQTGGTTSSSSISGGAIAGIVIGTLLAIGLIISVILWLFCVRRHRENDTKIDVNGYEPPAPTPSFHSAIQSPPMTYQGGMSMNGGAIGTNDRYRLNVPGFTDSRMKKDVVIYPNGDRQSNISLQDNQDYSRPVLRLTNPDP
ncbi:ER membrane protein [Histoplasma capsulatum var. duboisii H88]|uniref:ER membrane protein n=1 Tax=Ajellomyces capsulatus (strain H88) TaxID=544711 RepID=F0ULT2_AJEC8|nr:ER membrane protein [Histoplasma capsulatum var. duboisii H88]